MDYWELFIGIGAAIGVLIFLMCVGILMLLVIAYEEVKKWEQ